MKEIDRTDKLGLEKRERRDSREEETYSWGSRRRGRICERMRLWCEDRNAERERERATIRGGAF